MYRKDTVQDKGRTLVECWAYGALVMDGSGLRNVEGYFADGIGRMLRETG